jgi:succinoglycan biosynthesis transport protein ExoP
MTEPHVHGADERVEIDLSALAGALKRALRWLLPLCIAVAVAAVVLLQFVPSKYRAESKVLIQTSDAVYPGDVRGIEEERALLDNEGVASQVELLMSRDLLRRVAQRLDLASIPEFEAGPTSNLFREALVALGLMRDPGRNSPEERVLKVFYENLEVYRVDGSRVISVRFTSRDPERAARIANALVEEYLDLQSSVKRETTDFAATALEPQIERMRQEVKEAQEEVEAFRSQAGLLLGADNQTLDQQQLGELSTELSDARAAQSQAEARANLIRRQLDTGASLDSAAEVLNSQLVQRLRERQVELQSRIAELSTTLLPNHPQIRGLRSQLSDLERQIRNEAENIAAGLENEARVQQDRVASLTATLEQFKQRASRSNEDQIRLRELEREAQVKATQLDQLMTRYREADTRRNAPQLGADARVISRATVPLEPYSPKVVPIASVLTFIVFMLGSLWAILGQFLSGQAFRHVPLGGSATPTSTPMPSSAAPGYRAGQAGYAASGFGYDWSSNGQGAETGTSPSAQEHGPAMGQDVAPAVAAQDAVKVAASTSAPVVSPVADQMRPRRVAVLSVDSDEVAQEVTFRLVREAAEEGVMPLFLEVRPDLGDPEAVPGFAELLEGSASFAGVIYRDAASRAHVIESGRRVIDDELAEAGRFEMLMDAIDHTYDQVFFDLGLIDDSLISAQILAMADQVVVATGGSPAGPELEEALRMLEDQTGAPVAVEPVQRKGETARRHPDMAA